jgi:hypothetical protein
MLPSPAIVSTSGVQVKLFFVHEKGYFSLLQLIYVTTI